MKKLILVDLDNTLVFTDKLNNYSYNKALNMFGFDALKGNKRITRNSIPYNIEVNLLKEIVELKQKIFINNLNKTELNKKLINFLEKAKSSEKRILLIWTSANKTRVKEILKYYNLNNLFDGIIYSEKKDIKIDLKKIQSRFLVDLDNIVVFENDLGIVSKIKANDNHSVLQFKQLL